MQATYQLSLVIPVFNESEVLPILAARLNEFVEKIALRTEIVLIDDGSTDSTSYLMSELAVRDLKYQCIFLSRNYGHQRALRAGLEASRGEYVMILDADLQDPPEMFFMFFEKMKEGYEVVYGIRKKRKESALKVFAYNSFYRILTRISNYPIPRDSGDFCLMTRRVVTAMLRINEESPYMRGIRSWVGFKQVGVEYERFARVAGVPKYTFSKLLKLAYDGIFNFSIFPLKIVSIAGLTCILSSLLYLIVTIVRKFFVEDVPLGFTALLFVIILFGGVQLLSIGILGEYIHRIFFQVKGRPLYFINKRIIDGKEYND